MFSLDDAGFQIAKTYSYEAPRVGNTAFEQSFTERFVRKYPVFRVTHYKDPEVHLPPRSFGYTHVQTEVYYNNTGQYKVCPLVEDPQCADQWWNVPELILFESGDHCHSPLVP